MSYKRVFFSRRHSDNRISNYRDRDVNMPDSPDAKVQTPISPVTGSTAPRPLSASGNIAVMNGAHSPVGSMNGRTPSPAGAASLTSQQLPPACGARQLSKLKRFLTTLQQFGSDISPEIGERVRNLVLGLVNSHLSIEEFHAKLQEATNFPLRPFVIPFLKANLPLLQRELLHCARIAKQTPQQYLSHNEHILFDASAQSPVESQDQVLSEINDNRKRKSPQDRAKENVTETSEPPEKRVHSSLSPGHTVSPTTPLSITTGGPIRLQDINLSRELRERERLERERYERERLERERERQLASSFSFHRPDGLDHLERIDDDWKHVETMLHCIIGMVDKTKRALAVLQERSQRDREELAVWMRRQSDGFDSDMKKRTNEMMAHTLRQTEDRVSEVKRRAEEAVNEVKRQAVSELQKAVGTAETKANEIISNERTKIERSLADARKQAHDEVMSFVNTQEESSESCWNCGRKASETCSGCNVARYCGSFCQHKDWETHHRVCGQQNVSREAQSTSAPAEIPATTSSNSTQQAAAPSPGGKKSATSSKSGSRSGSPVETKSTEVTR